MKRHPKGTKELIIGLLLVFLLASSVVLTVGCSHKTSEVSKPLEPPFSEIIPTREDVALYYDGLEVAEGYERPQIDVVMVEEYTWSSPEEDVRLYKRVCVAEDGEVKIDMYIAAYPDETQAFEYFQDRVDGYSVVASAPCRERFEPTPDDALSYTYETDRWKYRGPSEEDWVCDGIIFRVGRYVGHYEITNYDPPVSPPGPASLSTSGIYYLPIRLYLMLRWAVETTIPKLRSLQPT